MACVESIASRTGRPVRPLRLQALLQLPRLADVAGEVELEAAEELLAELARELPPVDQWTVRNADSPRAFHFADVDPSSARNVMERFHYLRSPRTDGRAYGLSTDDGVLAALCVSSPLDVPLIETLLAARGRSAETCRSISRVFVFEGAPANTISYLLSRVGRAERRLGVTDLVTYVNPNMGFTGISYRASGWSLLGTEPGTTYRYLDGRYATVRKLALLFGEHDDSSYCRLLGSRFAVSRLPLDPLRVFHTRLA
jgi:hypothetical protein